jgi:hypothetical protein
MRRFHRKTAPRVRDGRVQRKNRSAPTPTYWNTRQPVPVVDRERPGPGARHLLRRRDVFEFVALLPEWGRLSEGLDAVLLARASDADGWYDHGVVGICAWDRGLWVDWPRRWAEDHRELLDRLGVVREGRGDRVTVRFTETSARAYQLLHVFLHELGHHVDHMTTRSRRGGRGEGFAEDYAYRHEEEIRERYFEAFGLP